MWMQELIFGYRTDPAPEIITHGPRKVEKKMVVKIISFIAVPIKNQSPLPNYSFLTNLHVFTAALMSHHANLKALYVKRVQHVLQESGNLRSPMQLPAIYARISNLVEWKNKTTKDLVKLSFQGLESCQSTKLDGTPRNPDEAIVQLSSPESDEIMITEARINIPVPETLKNMKENIDRDIAFDSNTGMLALRLRSKIGDSIIPALVERTIRVFRLVEFVKVLQEHEASLRCEQISLGKITFTYSMPGTQGGFDKMDVDMPSKRYTAVVDFSATENNMSFILEKGNPHLMVLDHMRSILNGKEGLGGVATLLPITLPVVTGLDSIEMTWGKVSKAKGEVFVLIRATDWYEFRYDIAPISTDSSNAAGPRTVTFEIKLRNRAGEPWWDIRRTDHPDPPGDDIEAVLKPVWNSSGTGFLGMRVSSVAQPHGVEELLSKIDEVVRNLVVAQKTAVLSPTAMQKSRSQGQQARQQPTPNQSQSSQGRNNQARREVVEID
jgi:mediator of RNA polymerase II transcription subunit 14